MYTSISQNFRFYPFRVFQLFLTVGNFYTEIEPQFDKGKKLKDFIGEKIITGFSEDSELIEEVGFC